MPFLLLAAATLVNGVIGEEVRITSVDGFIQLSNKVNNKANFSGSTVFLDSDIDFTGKTFVPIGNETHYFSGTFDGQGHVISNLNMTSSPSEYAGLFGYSRGLTIKNVILDSYCSITSSYSSPNWVSLGGFISVCYAHKRPCNIENSVNMGILSFNGTLGNDDLRLGGIIGRLDSYSYDSTVKNCANYGDIIHSGESRYTFIGGIVGDCYSSSSLNKVVIIYNCLNHGTITHNSTTKRELYLGGITGYTDHTTIENCVSGGEISTNNSTHTGSIVGKVGYGSSINYTYFTSDMSYFDKYGYIESTPSESNTFSYDNTTFELNGTASIGSYSNNSLIGALNAGSDYYTIRDYSHWILNKNKKTVAFTINWKSTFAMNFQIILLPSLTGGRNVAFDGWYEDSEFTTLLTSYEITEDTQLYGLYGVIFILTFEANGGKVSSSSKKVALGEKYGDLPEPARIGYTFAGWFTEMEGGDVVNSEDIVKITEDQILYVHWTPNNYTVTFEVDGGRECKPITQDYNTEVVLPEPTKTGYTFDCWCSDPELSKEYTETTMPAGNMTLYAKWSINQYNLTFVFNNGSENEVRTLDFNEKIVYPENVEKTGYTFNGWDNKPDGMPAENTTITAQWTANKYSVSFDVNGGDPLSESESKKQVTYGSPYGDLPEATRTGYTFIGWYTEEIGGTNTTAENIVKITANQTLYAHWTANVYTVRFEGNEGIPYKSSKEVTFEEEYEDLPTAERTGYTFVGWFTEAEGGEEVKSEDIVKITEDQILYVHWTPNNYTVTFEEDGGSECENITQDYNTEIVLPEPTKTGYTFDCWCSDPELSIEYTETTMPAEDVTLYAKWNINQYNLTFVFNNENENEVRILDFNSEIDYPENIEKTGYTFDGWDNKPDRMPAENITITAQWTASKYTVTFDVNGGNALSGSESKKDVTYDNIYGDLPEPTKTGYTFVGWFNEKNESITEETIVTTLYPHTLQAHWLEISSKVEIVFSTKDMTQKEIEESIKKYTDAVFEIALIDSGVDETRVIIKFVDEIIAEKFIETVKSSSEAKGAIKKVEFEFGPTTSFSTVYYPMLLLCVF